VIMHPRLGQHVRLHYSAGWRRVVRVHGAEGIVRIVPRGPGPRNVGVEIEGNIIAVPRGNLVAIAGHES
jgi:hypothetical protein